MHFQVQGDHRKKLAYYLEGGSKAETLLMATMVKHSERPTLSCRGQVPACPGSGLLDLGFFSLMDSPDDQ